MIQRLLRVRGQDRRRTPLGELRKGAGCRPHDLVVIDDIRTETCVIDGFHEPNLREIVDSLIDI